MFCDARSFNQPLNKWNVSNVTYMRSMFRNASSFNQPLNHWNVSNVTSIRGMFWNATSFNQPFNTSGNKWNVSNVADMFSMFWGASSFNQPLNDWNVSILEYESEGGALHGTRFYELHEYSTGSSVRAAQYGNRRWRVL